jgi:hypothetical protein
MCADPQKAPESSPSRRFGFELQTLTQGNPPPTLLCPTLPCPPLMIPQIYTMDPENQTLTRNKLDDEDQTLTRNKLEDEEDNKP